MQTTEETKNPLETVTVTRAEFREAKDASIKEIIIKSAEESKDDPTFGLMMVLVSSLAANEIERRLFNDTEETTKQ